MHIKTSINKTTLILSLSFPPSACLLFFLALHSSSQRVELVEHTRGVIALLVVRVRGAACCQLGRVSGQVGVQGLECLVQGLLLLGLGSDRREGRREGVLAWRELM